MFSSGSFTGLRVALERARRIQRYARLYDFVVAAWPIIEGSNEFRSNWHIFAICEHLEAVSRGEIKNLLINIPPGCMKEVHVDEPVLTERGRIRLGDVVVGDRILTHKGRYKTVEAIHDKGFQSTITFTTQNGRRIRAEVRHPFLTTRGWVEAKDVLIGDVFGAVTPTEDLKSNHATPEEARLLGYFIGDGSLTHQPSFTNADPDILQDFIFCAHSVGAKVQTRPYANSIAKRVSFVGGRKWLDKFGLLGLNSYTKSIPLAVLNSSNDRISNFLGAYWSCDGTVAVRHKRARGDLHLCSATTVSERLSYDLQHALLRLNISTRVRKKVRPLKTLVQGNEYVYYDVISSDAENSVKFRTLRGLCERKRSPLENLFYQMFEQGPLHEDEVVGIEDSGKGECRCLTVEDDHSFTANDIAVHNSLITSVCWPAWEWTRNPEARFLTASYAQELSTRDALKTRTLIESDWYKELWGDKLRLKEGQNQKTKYEFTRGGWRLSTSVGGRATGEHPDFKVVDDPHNAKEAQSEVERQGALDWFDMTLSTRGASRNSKTVVIMQRLHEKDLSGHIESKLEFRSAWTHLCLPMRYEPERMISTVLDFQDPRTKPGELLWPSLFPEAMVDQLEKNLGTYSSAGQLQQRPAPAGGGVIKIECFKLWPRTDPLPDLIHVVQSYDTAYTDSTQNDPTACTVWGVFEMNKKRHVMLLDCWAEHLLYPDLRQRVINDWQAKYGRSKQGKADPLHPQRRPDAVIVEQKGSGISLITDLRRANVGARAYNPGKADKFSRAVQATPLLETGCFWVLESSKEPGKAITWARPFLKELELFPAGEHDDYVDTWSQTAIYLRDGNLLTLPEAPVEFEEDRDYARSRREADNPYLA